MRRAPSGSMPQQNIHKISKPAQTVVRIFCVLPVQEISMPFEKLPSSGKWRRTSRAALFLTSTTTILLSAHAALASQGPGGGPGTAGPFTPTGDGHSRLWNLSAGGRRRADRRTAKALRTTGFNRGASSSSCEVRSPCRLAGIPARTWRCTPAPHSGRGSTWDKRHRVPPDTAGKCEPVWQAAGPEVAWRARPRSQAMPEQYACPAGRSALARPPRAMKQQATKQNLPKPLLPLS
jgi:hypothetical protein